MAQQFESPEAAKAAASAARNKRINRKYRELAAVLPDFCEPLDGDALRQYVRSVIMADEVYELLMSEGLVVETERGPKRNDLAITYSQLQRSILSYGERLGITQLGRHKSGSEVVDESRVDPLAGI